MATAFRFDHAMWRNDFLASNHGQRLLRRKRWYRRIRIDIDSLEPRSKESMPAADERRFRQAVQDHLRRTHRKAYRGPIVLRLGFSTTDRTPSHIHTLTKNFLDLLGRRADDTGNVRPLLYADDGQVHGLLVSCRHGEDAPMVAIESLSMSDFRDDLALAMTVNPNRFEPDAVDLYGGTGDWTRDEFVRVFGEEAWQFEWIRRQQSAQSRILRHHGLGVHDLAYLFRSPHPGIDRNRPFVDELSTTWERRLRESPFRITLDELPQRPGAASDYRAHVLDRLKDFREKFSRVLSPIRIPVALEVIVKPPPVSRAFAVHDLDNVLRRYLVPGVIETFRPPSSLTWALDAVFPRQTNRRSERNPPLSTATGLIRMEAWRVPRSLDDTSPGFINVGLVADDFGYGDSLGLVDRRIEDWMERD